MSLYSERSKIINMIFQKEGRHSKGYIFTGKLIIMVALFRCGKEIDKFQDDEYIGKEGI